MRAVWTTPRSSARMVGHRSDGHGVAVGVRDEADALPPWHLRGLADDRNAGVDESGEQPVDVVDVDEQLEAHTGADNEPVVLLRPAGGHDGQLGATSPSQPDIARTTIGRGQLE